MNRFGNMIILTRREYADLQQAVAEGRHWRNLYQQTILNAPTGLDPADYRNMFPFHFSESDAMALKNARTTVKGGAELNLTNTGVFDMQLRRTIRIQPSGYEGSPSECHYVLGGMITGYDDFPSGHITFHGKFQLTDVEAATNTQAPKLIVERNDYTFAITLEFEASNADLLIGYAIMGNGEWQKKL